MTIVYGQIESLNRIKWTLYRKGITRFNSIADINGFKKTYDSDREGVNKQIEIELNREIDDLQALYPLLQKNLDKLKAENTDKLNEEINNLKGSYDKIIAGNKNNNLLKIWNLPRVLSIKYKLKQLTKSFESIIQKRTRKAEIEVDEISNKLSFLSSNKEEEIKQRSWPLIRELDYIKESIEELEPLIAGAIGENLVEKELKKLSDKNILFNDFSLNFRPPIYNRKENDKIFSIQVDHLLLTNAGLFVIETKNWGKNSIESLNLRSPVDQIRRSSYALFVILNGDSGKRGISLKNHHWGNRQIPIRNIIVMINHKPKEQFKYVQVKSLDELNSYVNHFEPIFEDYEVNRISDYLKMI